MHVRALFCCFASPPPGHVNLFTTEAARNQSIEGYITLFSELINNTLVWRQFILMYILISLELPSASSCTSTSTSRRLWLRWIIVHTVV